METFWQDIRYSLRLLFKNKVVTLVALVTLALGIGANTAIFSVINAVLLRGLPYKDASQLVLIWEKLKQVDQVELSPDDFAAYERGSSFDHIAASERANFNLTGNNDPVRLEGQRATANLFETLGSGPMLGRTFTDEEDRTNARVVVLSYRLWQNRFAGDPQMVGRDIALNGSNYTVIGVMPAEFQYPSPINNSKPGEAWTPRSLATERERNSHNLMTIGRLRPGVSWEQARAELELISRQRSQELTQGDDGHRVNLVPLPAQVGREQRSALYVLVGAVGLVLLIACANVANLLLTLAAGRGREIALRLALGAKRSRIMRQLLTESLLLSLVGGGVGLLLAVWLSRAVRVLALDQIPRAESIEVDGPVLAFTILVSVATGLIFGLAPALQASRTDLNSTLKEGGRGTMGSGGQRLRGALIVSEVALSLLLLAGAGLMIKSFWRLQQVDPGFNSQNLLSVEVTLPAAKYPESQQRTAFFQQVLDKVSSLPGVSSAAVISSPPLSGRRNIDIFPIEGHPEPKGISDAPLADFRLVSPDYFKMMGIPILQGRSFSEGDAQNTTKVTIVSQSFATNFGAGENLLGKRLRIADEWFVVAGVVSDIHQSGLDEQAAPHVYVSYSQAGPTRAGVLVRTTTDPLSLVAAVRAQVQAVDKDQPIYNVNTMESMIAAAVAPRRLNLVLLGSFAALALALAAVGIYGVMANLVTQRTGEIGLRMALGAQRGDVLRLVMGRGLRLTLVGTAIGLGASFFLLRLMASLLFGVSTSDPFTFAAITALLLLVALLASYLPARRATKVDPLVALRYE